MTKRINQIIIALGTLFLSTQSFAQANADCNTLEPICSNSGVQFQALSGVTPAQTTNPGNNYDCLFSTPNPTWYYMQVSQNGDLAFTLSAPSDIDFIIYGPYPDLASAENDCENYGTPTAEIIDCSYSATNFETPFIPGASVGEVYVLLITNYANQVQDVNFVQDNFGQPGAGELDCNIVNIPPCVSDPGTHVIMEDPAGGAPLAVTTSPVYLCEGDEIQIISNQDFILPNDTIDQPLGDGIYSAEVIWLIYDGVPDLNSDPGADPNFTFEMVAGEDFIDINDANSPIIQALGCGTYWLVPVAGDDGTGGNNGVANGTNDNGQLHWDKNGNNCYLLGQAIEVTYACNIQVNDVVNCNPPTVINGVDLNISGGSGNYTVVNLGAGNLSSTNVPNGGTTTVSNLNNGSVWEVQITDAEGCFTTATGTFAAPIITDVTITPAPDCPLTGTGNVDVSVNSGSGNGGPYTIVMAGDPPTIGTSDSYTDVAGTIVPIVVADNQGCIADSTVTITSAGHFIDVQIQSVQGEECWGDGDGAAAITAFPTPTGNVTSIEWTNPLGQVIGNTGPSHTTETGMMVGIWTVCVTDDLGCEVCIPIEITGPQELDIFVENSNEPTCYGFSDASIDVSVTGGSQPYTFSWSHDSNLSNDVANLLATGDYWAYVTDGNGCMDSVNMFIDQPDSLWAEFTLKHILCYGNTDGGIIVDDVFNEFGNVSYIWQNMNPTPADTMNVAQNLAPGQYSVVILDDNGCSKQYDFTLNQNPEITFTELSTSPSFCRLFHYQKGHGVVSAAATGGVADYDYQWMNLSDSSTTNNTTWGGLSPGTYEITVTDDVGCTKVETVNVDSLNPVAAFDITSNELFNLEGTSPVSVVYTNQSQYVYNPNDPNSVATFLWNLDHNNIPWVVTEDYNFQPDTTYSGEQIFEVCLVAINYNGCSDTLCEELIIHDIPEIKPPNIFTPGTDGANDEFTFEFVTAGVETFEALIVDRWGTQVFEFNSINDAWNGDNANGKPCNDGTYFYTYKVAFTNGDSKEGQGTITLVRE